MDANLEKTYKKQQKIAVIVLLIAAIFSIAWLTIAINKIALADSLEKENEELKKEIQLLKKENAALKK